MKVIKGGPFILPQIENCPFVDEGKVHASICLLCKRCEIIPPIDKLTSQFFQDCLSHSDKKASSSILAQIQYLRKQDRLPIAILVGDALLTRLLIGEDNIASIRGRLLNHDSLMCFIAGAPVYYSRKLTLTEVQVVGEVAWK